MIGNLPLAFKNEPNRRLIFEAMIVANTGGDEPNAPAITILNDIDKEPCPPISFHYTNNLYCGDDIVPLTLSNLQGCECKGGCDANDQTCICLRRQEASAREVREFEDHVGFLYDASGAVKEHGLPIFECSVMCRCSDTCVNRVSRSASLIPLACRMMYYARLPRRVASLH